MPSQWSPGDAHTEAIRRIREAHETGLGWVHLGDLPITNVPDEIESLGVRLWILWSSNLRCQGEVMLSEWSPEDATAGRRPPSPDESPTASPASCPPGPDVHRRNISQPPMRTRSCRSAIRFMALMVQWGCFARSRVTSTTMDSLRPWLACQLLLYKARESPYT
jgi:hypothetical protein